MMPLLGLNFSCLLQNPIKPVDRPDFTPLKETHKGQLHEVYKLIQEEQGVVNCYV